MAQSNGGVGTTSRLTLYPMQNIAGGAIGFYAFDPSVGYNDPNAGGFYAFKVEEIIPGRVPTVRKIIAVYRDLGPAQATFQLFGVTPDKSLATVDGAVISSAPLTVAFGTAAMTGKLMTKLIDLALTGMNLQLVITRAANGGSLSFAKIIMCGNVEVGQEF